MKFCTFPFEYLYLDNYHGDLALCPWMKWDVIYVGNLNKQTAEEIWHGSKANTLRARIKNNDYSICRVEGCPFLQNNSLPDRSEKFINTFETSVTPKIVNLAYDFMCNQYCETCRPHKFKPILPRYRDYMNTIRDQTKDFLNKAARISTSGHGDPFASPYMMDLLANLRPAKDEFSLLLETNGVYFDRQHWEKIRHLANFQVETVVTVNSYNEFTYNQISRGGKLEKVLENLKFLKELKNNCQLCKFIICFVIQDRNFRELPAAIERSFDEFGADMVHLRPVYQWGTMPDDVFWIKDILNPLHPYHREYLQMLELPILNDKRVYNFGGKTLHPSRPFPRLKKD